MMDRTRKHARFRQLLPLTAVLLALVLLPAALPTLARPPHNIGLVSFEATVLSGAIRLDWEVATEIGTAGYKLRRGQNGSFAFLRGGGGGDLVIIAEGGPATGHTYSHTDEDVTPGATYVYQLVELTTAGDEVVQDELSVVMDFQPTSTPIILPTTGPGGGGGQSATLTPTPTAPATATRQPTSAPPTAVPNTPAAAATPIPAATSTAVPPTAAPAAASGDSNNNPPAPTSAPSGGAAAAYPAPDISEESLDGDVLPPSGSVEVAAAELPLEGSGYPGPEAAVAPDDAPAGSVAAAPADADAGPVVISGGAAAAPATPLAPGPGPVAAQEEGQEGGLLFLWLAFLAALTIFVAAVIGAIILYTRRKSG